MADTHIGTLVEWLERVSKSAHDGRIGLQHFSEYVKDLGDDAAKAIHPLMGMQAHMLALDRLANQMKTQAGITPHERLEQVRRIEYLKFTTRVRGEWADLVDSTRIGNVALMTLMFKYAADIAGVHRTIQTNLAEANIATTHRKDLENQILNVTAQTGISYEKTGAAAKALVSYGLDNQKSWSENLKVVTQLSEALGASVEQAAKLAALVETSLRVSFKAVADDIARIVNTTTLSVNQAMQVADKVGRALSLFGSESTPGFREATSAIASYEDIITRAGGATGEFTDFMVRLSRMEGWKIGGVFGVAAGPEALSGAQAVHRTAAAIAAMVRQAQKAGDMGASVQVLARASNTTEDMLIRLTDGLTKHAVASKDAITVDDLFRRQMEETNGSFERLRQKLWQLGREALLPIVRTLNELFSVLDKMLTIINESPALRQITVYATTILSAAGALTVLGSAAAKLLGILKAGSIATLIGSALRSLIPSIIARAVAGLATFGAGGAVAAGGTAAAGGVAIAPVLAIVAILSVIAAGVYALYHWNVKRDDEEKARLAAQRMVDERNALVAMQRLELRQALIRGDSEALIQTLLGAKDQNGLRTGGLIQNLQAAHNLSLSEAYGRILAEEIRPTVKQLRSTTASLTSYSDTEGTPKSAALEKRLGDMSGKLREAVEEQSKASAANHQKTLQALEAQTNKAILNNAVRSSGINNMPYGIMPYPIFKAIPQQ